MKCTTKMLYKNLQWLIFSCMVNNSRVRGIYKPRYPEWNLYPAHLRCRATKTLPSTMSGCAMSSVSTGEHHIFHRPACRSWIVIAIDFCIREDNLRRETTPHARVSFSSSHLPFGLMTRAGLSASYANLHKCIALARNSIKSISELAESHMRSYEIIWELLIVRSRVNFSFSETIKYQHLVS